MDEKRYSVLLTRQQIDGIQGILESWAGHEYDHDDTVFVNEWARAAKNALGNEGLISCNECHRLLTGEELASYDFAWQHSGDMYCIEHRDCPDDCRKTPCPALTTLFNGGKYEKE